MKKTLLVLSALLFSFSFAFAEDTIEVFQNSSNLAAKYLDINIGAQAAGMGNAFTGASTGAASLFWNPAGLAGLKTSEKTWSAFISHNIWVADISDEHLAVAAQLNKYGVFGLGFSYYSFGSMDNYTLDASGLPVKGGTFTSYALLSSLSYANSLDKDIDFGITLKYLHDEIASNPTDVVGFFDIGVRYFTPLKGLSVDILAKNFGARMNGFSVARELDFSAFYTTAFEGGWGLSVDGDIAGKVSANSIYRIGLEVQTPFIVAIRSGYQTDNTEINEGFKNFTFGLGLKFEGKYVDLAFEPYGTLGNAYKMSIGGEF